MTPLEQRIADLEAELAQVTAMVKKLTAQWGEMATMDPEELHLVPRLMAWMELLDVVTKQWHRALAERDNPDALD